MRDDMYENRWSPFDPKWYQEAFDKYVSTADQLFNQDSIIKQGYHIPDSDGSKSSVFRNESVLNNSFNENALRETLKDIYLNSSHKLVASNHDNVYFFQWHGHMSDMSLIPNTKYCEFIIPAETFIYPKERDTYKLSQFYRKWIKVEDILNNWNVFKWHCMLFIDKKIYSEYELRIDDHEVAIRFKYNDYWLKMNYPVYIYKFDTNAQCRVLISKELCMNQWDWKMPADYITDMRVANASNVIVAINKISDDSIRKDGLTQIEVLGDNLEFLKIEDGYIDLTKLSDFNKIYIQSESTEWLWMSIIIPKFFHEFPILLPTDVVYRPYEANFQPVVTIDQELIQNTKTKFRDTDDNRQVYVDVNDLLKENHDGWKQLIRPIVLSDAFEESYVEPYDHLVTEINNLRDLTVKGADIIEEFRLFILNYTNDFIFNKFIEKILNIMHSIREAHNKFLDKRLIDYNQEYEEQYKKFLEVMRTIENDGIESEWFDPHLGIVGKDEDFWFLLSPLIYIPRELADKYYIIHIIAGMDDDNRVLWSDVKKYLGQVRFQRPIEENDFWTFEYYPDDQVWRPYPLQISRHFPDVYLPVDTCEDTPSLNRIFKTFFFYSDTMNVRNESSDIIRATPSWDEDIKEYHFDQEGIYRDIFMEKFYWMGVRAIYKGLLVTQNRWEAIEYVIDNPSYERFNQLFLKSMDPYFKLGLATYLKSSNFEFPFDDAISKMEESMNTAFLGYKRITNFEVYLNKTWIPSYFDYITKIMDNWDYAERLVRRPRSTFDISRLLPILIQVQEDIFTLISTLNDDLDWIIEKLKQEDYNLNIQNFVDLKILIQEIYDNISTVLKFTTNLDLQIYSINDINTIINGLRNHIKLTAQIRDKFTSIFEDADKNNVYEDKRSLLSEVKISTDIFPQHINTITALINDFDMEGFMRAINDLRSYFDHAKTNPDDNSLIGHINKFEDPWSVKVKQYRNKLFQSTSILYGKYEPSKTYENDEVLDFVNNVNTVKEDISNFRTVVNEYWQQFGYEIDQVVIDKLEYTEDLINKLVIDITAYGDARDKLVSEFDILISILNKFDQFNISEVEIDIRSEIIEETRNMLKALSYIAGKNNKEDAMIASDNINKLVLNWNDFIDQEEEVFSKILSITKPPIGLIDVLENYQIRVEDMINYMDTVNIEFIPDISSPTYSDIYEVTEIELVTGGFNHNVGEVIFIPNLGSYKITSVDGDINIATSIEDTGYRNSVFRNPMWQHQPYNSITNGLGVGITVRPTVVKHTRIINDSIVDRILIQIKNAIYSITRNIGTPNPHNNVTFENDIEFIKGIDCSWNNIIKVYSEYMTNDVKNYMEEVISVILTSIEPCERYIEARKKINISEMIVLFEKFIYDSYDYTEKVDKQDENFFYYDELIRTAYNSAYSYYGTGTSWSDENELKSILEEIIYPINLYEHQVLDLLDISDEVTGLKSLCSELKNMISDIGNNLSTLPYIRIDINPIIRSLETKLNEVPKFRIDEWYQVNELNVADGGNNYKVGDVIEIVPELPRDSEGNYVHDMEDVIMNDVILVQVTEVNDGKVINVKSLMNYAAPYLIWGLRETVTRVGNGEGLKINVYAREITLDDSMIFMEDNDTNKLLQFDENDMFMFKFENIHDLNINYEVFIGGKQITNFVQRHESVTDRHHPNDIDVLYINANEVMSLQNSSIYIPAEHYFVYRIDDVKIKDPGAGYSVGQEIFVDAGQAALRFRVASISNDPYKGIQSVEFSDGGMLYEKINPTSSDAEVVTDSLNNIDDEYNVGYYDKLTQDGIIIPAVRSLGVNDYVFTSKRFDNLENGDRNSTFMYPDVNMPDIEDAATNGDPDYHWYQGSRIDNSQHPMSDDHIWNGIMNLNPPTDPFIPDDRRLPPGKPVKGEYQLIKRERIHNSENETNSDVNGNYESSIVNQAMIKGDLVVSTFADLPRHTKDYPDGKVGKSVIVERDETNNGHRMLYKIRTFVAAGFFVYDLPEVADYKWNVIEVDWMNCDFYPDHPSMKSQYPTAPWRTAKTYQAIQRSISDKKHEIEHEIISKNHSTYIHDLTVDDLSVFNWTTKKWEDLHDETKWKLEVYNNDEDNKWGFKLIYLEEGTFSYDMRLYLNKIPETQLKNAEIKRNASLDINAVIFSEVNNPAMNVSVNTGRHLRIKKLFPYEQKETFVIGKSEDGDPLGYEMNFKLAPYMHFKNEIHLEDVKIYNKSAGRFENILDRQLFEVRFKDPKANNRGYETQTEIIQSIIGNPGEGFVDGDVWAYNEQYGIHVFGKVTADFYTDGHLLTFIPTHCPNLPEIDTSLEFSVYQNEYQKEIQVATVMIEFQTKRVEVWGDGYIHNVTNRLAPIPNEFKVIVQYNLDGPQEYEIIIDKTPKIWTFIEPKWLMSPTFHLNEYNVQMDRLYVLTNNGRFPLINPSTGKPTLHVVEKDDGTDVTFLNLYRRYEHLKICSVPYPMRSVYIQRKIPSHGYIDLTGKINKPLNKKYFEFWVNGKLMHDEVTIITPTKIFLHGLKSLKNLEIIEINRDSNEYFSDEFLSTVQSDLDRPYPNWNYKTYLDDALEGKLSDDNYTEEEQEYLLSPVWKQVAQDHPEFKNYPPNVDIEEDVLIRTNPNDFIADELSDPTYQFLVIDVPKLEGHAIVERTLTFEHFGFIPISDSMIIDMLNEEWQEEIQNDSYLPEHSVITDDEWYGMATRLYDEYGILVHNLNESAYHVTDDNLLRINVSSKLSRIVRNPISYDLT